MNIMLAGIWTLRAILVRFQTRIRNVLLEIRGEVILVLKWQKTSLNFFFFGVLTFCGRQNLGVMKVDV